MVSLAGLLKAKGHEVAGSDEDMYEPMKSMLAKLKIPVFTPYKEFHVKQWKPDVVIVGNAIGRGNREVEYMLSIGQLYRSMSDILLEEFISPLDASSKKSIVIAGTHGKTTTTALISWIFECAKLDPTIFVGGFMRNIDSTFKLGGGEYIVLEGDEYDTAFFDKGPKFWHYRPFIGVVNNVEFDHVDIFKDFDAYKFAFARFVNLIPENGLLVVSRENKDAWELVQHAQAKFHMKHFGIKKGDYTATNIVQSPDQMMFQVKHEGHRYLDIQTNLTGFHNISNILAAISVADFVGVSHETLKKAIKTFQGVKRRTEIIGEKNGITVIDDYAHHPTAVRETLIGLKKKFHGKSGLARKRIVLMFEPGSASSKRRLFEKQYFEAFKRADVVYLYKPFKSGKLSDKEMFHGKQIVASLNRANIYAKYFENIDNLLFHMKHDIKTGDIIVIMSCRGFDGLRERIMDVL